MQRSLLMLGLILAPVAAAAPHGGAYVGPADSVPSNASSPRAGAGGDTVPPPSAGGGKSGPGGGKSIPGQPGTCAPGSIHTTPQIPLGDDPTSWRRWWAYNQSAYIDVRSAVWSVDPDAGFLGRGDAASLIQGLAPTREDVHKKVVPALLRILETEKDQDLVTGALVALARIGDTNANHAAGMRPAVVISRFLDSPNQEIGETAAICLGILGSPRQVPRLAALLLDESYGRDLVGRPSGVPVRTRAFAAYGLGLIGQGTSDVRVRRQIARALMAPLKRRRESASADLELSCTIALGLVPLPPWSLGLPADADIHLEDQLSLLFGLAAQEHRRDVVRAQAPVAAARLVEALPSDHTLRHTVLSQLVGDLARRGQGMVEANRAGGIVLALGRLGDAGSSVLSRQVRRELQQQVAEGRGLLVKRFALLALGQIGARPGASDHDGLEECRSFLAKRLVDGGTLERPWAGLAIGILGHRLTEAGHDTDPALDLLLVEALADARPAEQVGALALACGLRKVSSSVAPLLVQLERMAEDDVRGQLCLALGMVGDAAAIEAVATAVRGARYRPNLMRQGALALGLMGDKEMVPELLGELQEARSLSSRASVAQAIGAIGDVRSLEPLIELLHDGDVVPRARAFSAVALGLVCDPRHRPWNSALATGVDYRANVPTLSDGQGAGVLEIL